MAQLWYRILILTSFLMVWSSARVGCETFSKFPTSRTIALAGFRQPVFSFNRIGLQSDTVAIHKQFKYEDRWFGEDKFAHLLVSAYLTLLIYKTDREIFEVSDKTAAFVSISSTLALGLSKEVYDKSIRRTRFSFRDLTANLLGIGLGFFAARL